MTARTIVGLCGLLALLAVTLYLLFQIPWEYGIVVLAGLLWVIGVDEPDALP